VGRAPTGFHFLVLLSLVAPTCGFSQQLDSVKIAKSVSPAVVLIRGATADGNVVGSGFIVSSDGKIATNLHVIRDLVSGGVTLSSGENFDSFTVLAFDEQKDLAIIKVPGVDMPSVVLGNSDDVEAGEPVLIVGNPLGLQGSVTTGVISAMRDDPFGGEFMTFQTDAAVSPGNSGGPVVNRNQQVIGVVVYRVIGGENLNFAVPANYLRALLNSSLSPMPLEELPAKLMHGTVATAIPPKSSVARSPTQIPNWWLSSPDPKRVLADPLFPTLSLDQRTQVLMQIDPKFAKLSSAKRHSYLWLAETNYLPKAAAPREVVTWNAGDPKCSTEFDPSGSLRKIITASDFRVEATIHRGLRGFLYSHLTILNNSSKPIDIVPQTFLLNVVGRKQFTLFFEYPQRVTSELYENYFSGVSRLPMSEETAKVITGALIDVAQKIVPESMNESSIPPGELNEGNVWFEQASNGVREVVLRVFVGERAFDFDFPIQ
jgi:hypothetical protein